jgi:hypothetical protein
VYCYTVRLACLSHAASVQAEPGSNSSINFFGTGTPATPRHSCELIEDLRFRILRLSSK